MEGASRRDAAPLCRKQAKHGLFRLYPEFHLKYSFHMHLEFSGSSIFSLNPGLYTSWKLRKDVVVMSQPGGLSYVALVADLSLINWFVLELL